MINMAKTPVQSLSVQQKSYLFALCSEYAYLDPIAGHFKFNEIGYSAEFITSKNSDCYILRNNRDLIIVFRGTQPSQYADIKADLNFEMALTKYSKSAKVHEGFRKSVDRLWPLIISNLSKYKGNRNIWCTGHSLGGAMATLMSYYMCKEHIIPIPSAVFTYGCPKVGNKNFINDLQGYKIPHFRFVNNADIITRLPPGDYEHVNEMYYMNHWGNIRPYTEWQMLKDRLRGFIKGLKVGEINYFTNHDIKRYRDNLDRWAKGIERPQTVI